MNKTFFQDKAKCELNVFEQPWVDDGPKTLLKVKFRRASFPVFDAEKMVIV